MLPIVLDCARQKYVAIGTGEAFDRRLALLREASCEVLLNPSKIPENSIVFIAGLDEPTSAQHYEAAHAVGAWVNTEDKHALCDFHMPAQVRRGDLLLTVSTSGRAPGLARVLKQALAAQFGEVWQARLDEIAAQRQIWRKQGKNFAELSAAVKNYVEQKKWI